MINITHKPLISYTVWIPSPAPKRSREFKSTKTLTSARVLLPPSLKSDCAAIFAWVRAAGERAALMVNPNALAAAMGTTDALDIVATGRKVCRQGIADAIFDLNLIFVGKDSRKIHRLLRIKAMV